MDTAAVYEIRVEGCLSEDWSDWFEGLSICNTPHGEATLTGALRDQAALFGVLAKILNLHLILISVQRIPDVGKQETSASNHADVPSE